jgi:hypothetical protein
MSAVLTPGRIQPPLPGTFSSQRRHQSSCSWTGKTSSSKNTGSSLASARRLLWWQVAVVRVDLRSKGAATVARVADSCLDLFQMAANVGDGKP